MTTFKPQIIDIFFRRESNTKGMSPVLNEAEGSVELDSEVGIDELLEIVGYRGSHRSGVYEIQTNEGIFQHIDSKKMDNRTSGKRAKILFKTWKQMEQEELLTGDFTFTTADSIGQE
jgi:hypothetical protein